MIFVLINLKMKRFIEVTSRNIVILLQSEGLGQTAP